MGRVETWDGSPGLSTRVTTLAPSPVTGPIRGTGLNRGTGLLAHPRASPEPHPGKGRIQSVVRVSRPLCYPQLFQS